MGNGTRALIYLITTVVDLYVVAIMLRVLLQWVRADFYNPVCQFLVKITQPILGPLRRLIPSIGPLDTAAVVLMIVVEAAGIWLVSLITAVGLSLPGIAILAGQKLALALLTTYFVLIIASVILSWVGGRLQHPIVPLIYQLTEPVLRPIRRFIPPIGGFDLTPIVALIAIRVLMLLVGW